MKVAILDGGIDLLSLYRGDRHGYQDIWIKTEDLTYQAISNCDLLIIPAGSDNTLLNSRKDCIRFFLEKGGWVFSFDGLASGVFDDLGWIHSRTDYRSQSLDAPFSPYSFLLEGVPLESLSIKDGVKGWWCEGELIGDHITPFLKDQRGRIIAGFQSYGESGLLFATAAARLPMFSANASLGPNILFSNLLSYRKSCLNKRASTPRNLLIHSGNWAHRSFLASEQFKKTFIGVHWSLLDDAMLVNASSIWIPWESNIDGLKKIWPILEQAVVNGVSLVIEDLRGGWFPGLTWHPRPVDSSWWREDRNLDLAVQPAAQMVFGNLPDQAFFWHYHGVFDHVTEGKSILTTSSGHDVLCLFEPNEDRRGRIFASTLDAVFEFGAGKIKETATYIEALLEITSII
jgi:hypothetical protein